MTWFKVDDSFHSHPKVLATSPAALGLWVVAGAWVAKQNTGGHVPSGLLGAPPLTLCAWERTDYRRRMPDDIRRLVYERDENRCTDCGSTEDLTLDHIHPWSKGGKDTPENLRVLCRSCNSSKGART